MDNGVAAAEALEAISASALALAAEVRRAAEAGPDPAGPDHHPDHIDPLGEQATAFLDGLSEVAGMEARLAAVKVHLASGYVTADAAMMPFAASPHDRAVRQMSVTAEVAGALTISEGAAARLLVESSFLSEDLPVALAALQAGSISWQHARIMCDEIDGLNRGAVAALEAHFLDPEAPGFARGRQAGELTPARFRAKVRYWRERHHQDSIETRHRHSVKDRRLEYQPDRDGMAWLSAYLPADQAAAIWNGTTATARGLQGPNETRTLSQLRADVFSTRQLSTTHLSGGQLSTGQLGPAPRVDGTVAASSEAPLSIGEVPSPAAQVLVTVPVFSLLGHTDEPALLDGYGPIPPSMARRLVANGATSFFRVLVDPRDGAPLEIGRTSYRLIKPMRQWLRFRDAKCTFPNCSNQALDNDADHILAWADGGPTGISNLGQLCPKHHRLKHSTAWRPVGATRDKSPGWISPSGRHFPAEHQDWEPPTWPELDGSAEAPPNLDLPEPTDYPEPPDWFDAAPTRQDPPEPPDSFDAPPGQVLPEPADWFDAMPTRPESFTAA